MSSVSEQLSGIVLNAMSWAREAGAVHMRYFRGSDLDITSKLNDSDVVTAADRAAEQLLIAHIVASYPTHTILSEETGASGVADSSWRWVIDPLDGTTNFSQGLPLFCVSVGIEHDGLPVAAVVFAPATGELFHAIKGEGAWLNGHPIRVSGKTDLAHSVVATGFPVDKHLNPDNNLDNVARVMPRVRGLRRLGSAALDLCYVAAGYLDAYWEMNLHEWDVAAGVLIVEEAGGTWSPFRADRHISIVAGTPAIHQLIANEIK